MKVGYRWFLGLVLLIVISGCDTTKETRVIKLAHGLDVNHSVHKAMLKMSEDLEKLSGGKMTIKIYPNQQLGSERESLELLQIGSLDMTKVSVGVLENFAPDMKVFGIPFLFRDKQHSFSVLDGPIGKKLLEEGEKFWLKGLCYYDAGSRSFYTKDKQVTTPDDLKGLKIRVMESATAMDMVRSLGGAPTPISWGELYTSLQQGVVDGAENNPPSFYLSRHYEVCKYYTINEHTMLPDALLVSTHLWGRLSEQEQQWLQEAADNSVAYQRELWAISEREALEEVEKAGVEVIYPDKAPFEEAVQGLYDQYKDDKVMSSLIEQIQQTN
ncbi:tripartite ATP-independent transporter solute receptor, DctP family [Flagellimonas taeanensis]|uniref:Tripartite ATP-independent transporter solute receptor, DctP family n=1 Tax=Flagellimonas taeanensis TaxID=1005926 RepID=A0A1M7C744_9FLAO|nr:TRAP transporter substrate-binding protein [Allomuricauda taeanensis]SFC60894.1 tripartite ATP-independent transporter solute receptor, DctP family [Allomuricauda taeanensis]SHL63122.1 tripartite ATP-independent transporter solute receptor, DctP family [Allomuricauda taeanensis]